jgi:integrase/recombinase XerC
VKNSSGNPFRGIHVGPDEEALLNQFLDGEDFSAETRRAMVQDVRSFARWFTVANAEAFRVGRVTVRDVADFRQAQRDDGKAVATVNRRLVTLRKFFAWLLDAGHVGTNPAAKVKQLRKQSLAPQGLDRSQVRKLLREAELRSDLRATAIFHLMLFTGCRIGDVVGLELHDVVIGDRSGSATFRSGKGRKQRTVPLPLPARRALQAYLDSRPPIDSAKVFVGERGALTDRGVRNICAKYSAITGVRFHPHALRHSFAKRFLAENDNDLVSLAQILGHESISTTARYTQRNQDELAEAVDRMGY